MLVFRYPSRVSIYLISAMSFWVAVLLWIVLSSRPESLASIPTFVWLGFLLFFGFILYGVHMRTLEITIGEETLRVKSIFIDRHAAFRDIKSVRDLDSQTWRTLDVQTKSGRRVLYLSSTGFPEYAQLVDVLTDGVAEFRRTGPRADIADV